MMKNDPNMSFTFTIRDVVDLVFIVGGILWFIYAGDGPQSTGPIGLGLFGVGFGSMLRGLEISSVTVGDDE
jgi:hypothetical protein